MEHLRKCLIAALAGADAGAGTSRALVAALNGEQAPVLLLAAGKAASTMAAAALPHVQHALLPSVVVTKYSHTSAALKAAVAQASMPIQLLEAGHPEPDEACARAALCLRDCVQQHARGATVIVLLSGGGSALIALPADGISFAELVTTNSLLLACGATIHEVNTVRKHTSALLGGQLAALAEQAGARALITLTLSDVIGDRADVIASGPTVPDSSTAEEAMNVLKQYGVWEAAPQAVRDRLMAGVETPKRPVTIPCSYMVVASNRTALQAAKEQLLKLGYRTTLLTSTMHGEAKHVASMFAALIQEHVLALAANSSTEQPSGQPIALLAGGETTVTLHHESSLNGQGGRNQEFALAVAVALGKVMCLLDLQQRYELLVASFGTDGTDGPTDAAGAVVTGHTLAAARAAGLDPQRHLHGHDAYTFFSRLQEAYGAASPARIAADSGPSALQFSLPSSSTSMRGDGQQEQDTAQSGVGVGGLIKTGPTGTNIMDMVVVLLRLKAG